MEKLVNSTTVNGKNSLGCKRLKKDIMIAFVFDEKGLEYGDFFMSKKTALKLQEQLTTVLNIKEKTFSHLCTIDGEENLADNCVLDESNEYSRKDCSCCCDSLEIKKREDCEHWNKVVEYK